MTDIEAWLHLTPEERAKRLQSAVDDMTERRMYEKGWRSPDEVAEITRAAEAAVLERAAKIASEAMLVPPDGGLTTTGA